MSETPGANQEMQARSEDTGLPEAPRLFTAGKAVGSIAVPEIVQVTPDTQLPAQHHRNPGQLRFIIGPQHL